MLAAVAVAFVPSALPQEKTASASAPAPQRDAIAVAKKEFEALNAVRNEQLLPQSALPRASAFELPALPASPPPVVVPNAITPPRETRVDNWLVEAMEKETASRESRGESFRMRGRRGSRSTEDENSRDAARGQRNIGETRQDGSEAERERNDDADSNNVVNPLTRYLGEWMTPQDYALLKPSLAGFFNAPYARPNTAGLGEGREAVKPGGAPDFGLGGALAPFVNGTTPQRANPYLEPLKRDLPVGAISGTAKPSAPGPVTSISPTLTSPPARTLPPTKIPEFAKTPADDKYFKPLKRF